jgi:hypothetical protein
MVSGPEQAAERMTDRAHDEPIRASASLDAWRQSERRDA